MIYFAQQTDSVVRICAAFKENSEIRTTNAEKTVCLKKKEKKKKKNVGAKGTNNKKKTNRNRQAEL